MPGHPDIFLLATQKYQVAPACIPSQQSYNHNISGGCQIKIGQIQYRLGIKQKKDSQSIVELTGDLEYQSHLGTEIDQRLHFRPPDCRRSWD